MTWVPRHGGRQYLRLLLNTSRSLLLTSRHGGWPSREGWEGEKAKGGESYRVGKVRSSSMQCSTSVHVFHFTHNTHYTYLTFVYLYIFCLVHIYLWYRWVQQVPEWVGQQFYRHGLFCASQVILSPALAKSFYCKNPWVHWSGIGLCWDHITVHSSGILRNSYIQFSYWLKVIDCTLIMKLDQKDKIEPGQKKLDQAGEIIEQFPTI